MRILSFLLFTFACWTLQGQNMSFIPFGQAQEIVLADLSHYERPLGKAEAKENRIVNQLSPNRSVHYIFKEDQLFQIEDIRLCADREEAKELEESLKAYLGLFKQTKVMDSQGGNSHYASILKDRIVEVVIENDRKTKQIQIILRSTSRFHGPRMETEQLVSLVRQEASLMN